MNCYCQEHEAFYQDSTKVVLIPTDFDTIITLTGLGTSAIPNPAEGLWTVFYDANLKNKAYQVTISKGRISGIKTEWYRNGNIKSKGKYSDLVCLQDCIRYFESGAIKYKREYKKRQEGDTENWYYKSGKIKKTIFYIDKIPIKAIGYYKNGQIKREYFFKASKSYIEGFEPFLGVEFDSDGMIIGPLIFNQKIYWEGDSQKVKNRIKVDTLKTKY